MPELPDIESYIDALHRRITDERLIEVVIVNPFLLRTAEPPLSSVFDHRVSELRRIGKRIAIGFDNDHWLVLHLMIAGRLHWQTKLPSRSKRTLALLTFESGTLSLTEAGSKRRASLHVVVGQAGLDELDPGGLEALEIDFESFRSALTKHNHTLKRALTDPHIFSGIGNAYSDEILHHAGLSPVQQTKNLEREEIDRLFVSTRVVLSQWRERLAPAPGEFPEKVTAFREGMAVHGRFGQACPRCGTAVQRIRYVSNETNYCPRCQTGGKLLADRSLSRLLRRDWPKSIDELERAQNTRSGGTDRETS